MKKTIESHPKNLIDQYLKTSNKLKKFDRVVFKRFAPNALEVLNDFNELSMKFEDAGIYQYAAMCYLGAAKCEKSNGNNLSEVNCYLKSARAFLKANQISEDLQMRSNKEEYREGALKSYYLALTRVADDGVLKAAIIRETTAVNSNYDGTSTFSSPSHRIFDMELSAKKNVETGDYLGALERLTDIYDNLTERKKQHLYSDLLKEIEICRLLLLVILNLPPSRQSPSHIKLVEYYYNFSRAGGHDTDMVSPSPYPMDSMGLISFELKCILSDIVVAWHDDNKSELGNAIDELCDLRDMSSMERILVENIMKSLI
ncbi:uncharacterized protein LOC129906379 [Episyrphus balteatus]|uniref:uncharacterized protein LOC129906379 n=1 Tax=Episyrphus balteatus TaxID=286459 RepID=UPI0024859DE4|nr:uncharacterized protein LOC129906379 [Episyrphus balteatus]